MQCIVERNEFGLAIRPHLPRLIEIDFFQFTPALLRIVSPRMLDQNAPHKLRGDTGEMGAVFPIRPALIDHFQICFMDQGRCLEGMVGPFPP